MGEEEKKTEEKKPEEAKKTVEKKEEPKTEEKKSDEGAAKEESKETLPPSPPPPPKEIILRVFMHCEGCARKVRRCLKNFPGVEDVITDCKSSKVVVKGEKAAADPLKVLERVQRKSHRQVELISPIPKQPSDEEKKVVEQDKEKPKPEEKKEEPQVITVILRVHMHCEACAQEIKKRIMRMKGVDSAEPDLKSSQVTVIGIFDPPKLVEYVYKRTGKHADIVKQEPEKKEEDKGKDIKDEKKGEEAEKVKKADGDKEDSKKNGGGSSGDNGKAVAEGNGDTETTVVELKRNEYYYYPPKYTMEHYSYPPQIFSDENPNACTVM